MADRVERLTNLLALLLETPEPLTLVEIAGALEGQYPESDVARRGAFERDKAALRSIGVPIEQEVVAGGPWAGSTRYWVDRSRYELQGLDLDDDERRALQVAVAAVRSGTDLGQEALWKLGAGLAEGTSPVAATVPSLPALPLVRDAVARRALLRFSYRGVDREVEPWGLLLRDGFWYLVAFDRVRGDRRTFRVDRIEGDVAAGAGGEFERPEALDLRTAVPDDPKVLGDPGPGDAPVDAHVLVDASRAPAVVRELGESRVLERRDDGSVVVVVPAVNRPAFRSWVLGLLDHAEVLGPTDLRDDVVAWLEAVAVPS